MEVQLSDRYGYSEWASPVLHLVPVMVDQLQLQVIFNLVQLQLCDKIKSESASGVLGFIFSLYTVSVQGLAQRSGHWVIIIPSMRVQSESRESRDLLGYFLSVYNKQAGSK